MNRRRHDSAAQGLHLLPLTFAGLATLALVTSLASRVDAAGPLVTQGEAARHGLERAWYAQIPLDPARSRVSSWFLYFDRLYGVTDSGIATALDAETGAQLWSRQIGKPGAPSFGPSANEKYLGIVSGVKLYLLDRHDGRIVWSRVLGSAPSSGPALSMGYAYVALITGRIEGYQLDDPATQPWYYQSKGRTFLRPTVTGRVVSWPTSAGYLYVSRAEKPGVLFRLQTKDDIVTSPAQQEPYIYIASLDGYLYCMHELTGDELWRYSTGYSIHSSPAIVGETAYVASFEPALHAVDAATGKERWTATGASHFAALGKERVYASDSYGTLLVLDGKTGNRLGRLNVAEGLSTLVNDQSDRLFLVNDRGLAQCLREIGADKPTMYRRPLAPPAEGAGAATPTDAELNPFEPADEAAAPADAEGEEPPFVEEPAAEPAAEPDADAAEEPAMDEPVPPFDDDDNLFDNQ